MPIDFLICILARRLEFVPLIDVFKTMNHSGRSFTLVVCLTLLLCILVVTFFSNRTVIYAMGGDVAKFDKENKEVINSLLDSLRRHVGEYSSYLMELRRDIYDTHFSAFDSVRQDQGFFYPDFKLNKKQAAFFLEASAGNVFFDKQTSSYRTELFEFKQGDLTVWLLICRDKECKRQLAKPILYENDNRIYYVDQAWP